ncbi:MAG: hypothetical protein ACLRNZ_01105 [Blautia massiliensis (ex Durand et al. 2017)]
MEEPKTLSYDWQYGREELFLTGQTVTWSDEPSVCRDLPDRSMATRKALPTLR